MPKYKVKICRLSIFGKQSIEIEVEGTVEEIKEVIPKEVSV